MLSILQARPTLRSVQKGSESNPKCQKAGNIVGMSWFAVSFVTLRKNSVIIFHVFSESFSNEGRCEGERIKQDMWFINMLRIVKFNKKRKFKYVGLKEKTGQE